MTQAEQFAHDFITGQPNVCSVNAPKELQDGTVIAPGLIWQEHITRDQASMGFFCHPAEFTVKTEVNERGEMYAKSYGHRTVGSAIDKLWQRHL